tara:strand:- start:268 stop:513 length:246 start_codon:yes stop_codon:yes gene_type:complete
MTTQELFNLPTNRATIKALRNSKDFYKNASLYSTIIKCINDYLALPKTIKSFITKPTTESIYKSVIELKNQGFRKEVKKLA